MIRAPNIRNVLLPAEFDPVYYRETYPDLVDLSDHDLRNHFMIFGKTEGRFGTPYAGRSGFLELASQAGSVLEIDSAFDPAASGQGETFDAVLSSHRIENQPSLIRHLRQVHRLLKPGGSLFLIVSDKRFGIDHFLPISTIADVLDADDSRQVHTIRNVVEDRALTTHTDPVRHWAGDHGEPGSPMERVDLIKAALAEHSPTAYIDVHAWKFVPESFRQIMEDLVSLGLSDLVPERVFNTPYEHNEFCAILTRRN